MYCAFAPSPGIPAQGLQQNATVEPQALNPAGGVNDGGLQGLVLEAGVHVASPELPVHLPGPATSAQALGASILGVACRPYGGI